MRGTAREDRPSRRPDAALVHGDGRLGVPVEAVEVSVNVTVVNAATAGPRRLLDGMASTPSTSTISFRASRTRANNASSALGTRPQRPRRAQRLGEFDLIVDVNGYYR